MQIHEQEATNHNNKQQNAQSHIAMRMMEGEGEREVKLFRVKNTSNESSL